MLLDVFVHHRVGEHRLITLIVTEPTIAEDVDHNVLLEFLAEFCRHLGRVNHSLWIIPIHVENRGLDHQCDVRWIRRRTREMRRCCKADLVVHNHMHGATSFMANQARQAKTFRNNTLTGKGRITMQQ